MKKYIFLIMAFVICAPISVLAQDEVTQDSTEEATPNRHLRIDKVYEACMMMQEGVEENDIKKLEAAALMCEYVSAGKFTEIHCDSKEDSLKGHFVFDKGFVYILIEDSTAYTRADEIYDRGYNHKRGGSNKGGGIKHAKPVSVHTRTCLVKANDKIKYNFPSNGTQELAVVAEPGGLVAVRIHATNKRGLDEWHNDTKNAQKGARSFKTSFELPEIQNTVEVEVRNCTNKDTSFVLISN